MIQDLHSHTYYSFCSSCHPDDLIKKAIDAGVELLGITDHNYGIAGCRPTSQYLDFKNYIRDYKMSLIRYIDHIRFFQKKYEDVIDIKCGIEVATSNKPNLPLPDDVDLSGFDYCLLEHIDKDDTLASDVFKYAKKLGCKYVGIAHTDLFAYCENMNIDAKDFFSQMSNLNMFWEMNVNYDSIHNYQQHEYVEKFLISKEQQDIILDSGIKISVGFDSHRSKDYNGNKITSCCERLKNLGVPLFNI